MILTAAPAMAELKIELDRANALREKASARNDAHPDSDKLQKAFDSAVTYFWGVIDQIAAVPPSSMADLKVKAYAFDWAARLTDDEPYQSPTAGEELILHQLVAGLLNERATVALQKAKALLDAVDFDQHGAMVAGQWVGGNGGLISRETIKAADELRKALTEAAHE